MTVKEMIKALKRLEQIRNCYSLQVFQKMKASSAKFQVSWRRQIISLRPFIFIAKILRKKILKI